MKSLLIPLTDEQIQVVMNNPLVTPDDLEEIRVQVENERGLADPYVKALLTMEGAIVLAEYLITKEEDK
jgi:hypothetical protein